MSQTYQLPTGGDKLNVAIKTHIANALEALRTCFSGSSEPSSTLPYQLWADTSTGLLKLRNAANSAWIKLAPMAADAVTIPQSDFNVASLSATTTRKLGAVAQAGTVKRLVLLCDTASTSSTGNEWRVMLSKRTNAAPGTAVDLFSGNVGTFTVLSGVGGGVEFTAYKVLTFTPNQNATVAIDDVLTCTMTLLGTGTTLVNFMAWAEVE